MQLLKNLSLFLLLLLILPGQGLAQKNKKKADEGPDYDVMISTSMGDIKVKLFEDTPLHRENFLKLASEEFYDGTTFHRVIAQFMIQGGDPNTRDASKKNLAGQGGPGYTIPAEILPQYFHKKGVLSAARQGDNVNPKRASSGSQFYIVQGKTFTDAELDNAERRMASTLGAGFKFTDEQRQAYKEIGGSPWLDQQYTVFGEVVEGLDVVDQIAAVKVSPGNNRPLTDITMTMTVNSKGKKKKKKKKEKKAKKEKKDKKEKQK